MFWSVALRDVLFDITFFIIFSWNVAGMGRKLQLRSGPGSELLSQVFGAAVDCQGFFLYISGSPDLESI